MTRLDWRINVVTAEENRPDLCFIVGIAADEYGEGGYFALQAGLEAPGEQERQLGLDSYCILNEAGGVAYGGIENVHLSSGEIRFRFTSEAAVELGLPSRDVEIDIALGVDVGALRDGLRRVLTYGNPDKTPEVLEV